VSVPGAEAHAAAASPLELLGRIHRAAGLADALGALLDTVLVAWDGGRALVLRAGGDRLRGVAARGWPSGEVNRLEIARDDPGSSAARAARESRTVWEETGPAGLPEMGRHAAVPLPGVGDEPFGVLVVEGDGDAGAVAELARHAGPALARLAEAEGLRRAAGEREMLAALVDALPDPVLVTGPGHGVLLENARARALFSIRPGDGSERRRLVGINNLLLSSFLARGGGTGPLAARELNLVDPDHGADLLFEVASTPIPAGEGGGEEVLVSVLRDVTDLRRASTELEHQVRRVRQAEVRSRREADRLNLILENVGDPILVTDEDARVLLMNRGAERLFQAPAGVPAGSPARRGVRLNDTRFSAFVSEFTASGGMTRTAAVTLVEPVSGESFPAEVLSGKILNERGEVAAVVSVIHDLTKVVENERLAGELRQLNEGLEDRVRAATAALEERNARLEWQSRELERAYRLKSEFLASMSHELRTPINALLGYTSLMRDRIYGELTERQEEALQRMYAASSHLLALVNDILDLAKIEAGKMPVHLEPVVLAEVMRELAETVEPMVRARGLAFEVELEPELPVLETDRTRVKQILLNLLSNAVKFTHEGEVRVRAVRSGGGVEVSVRDTGIGIPPEHVQTIFEDFRQVDQSSTREYGGTGLGLSIVTKLLDLLGGSVRVESALGEGSVFTVWLPLRSREVVVVDDAHPAVPEPGTGG
jgi:PAS domain S-box-containing protein